MSKKKYEECMGKGVRAVPRFKELTILEKSSFDMNVKSLLELKERIDEDLAWRKKELTAIKLDVESSMTKSDSEQSRAIRAGITFFICTLGRFN